MEKLQLLKEILNGAAGSVIVIGIWFMLNFASKRKQEKGKADLAAASADGKKLDNLKTANELQDRQDEKKDKKIIKLEKQVEYYGSQQTLLINLIYEVIMEANNSDIHFCELINCSERKPPLGTRRNFEKFLSKLDQIKKNKPEYENKIA